MKSFLSRHYKSLLLLLGALAVAGVGYFDTYPTYLAKEVTLSSEECSQVALLVSVHAYKLQNPTEAVPKSVMAEVDKGSTRLAKRVAKYIIEKSDSLENVPPGYLYQGLLQSCVMSNGEAVLN